MKLTEKQIEDICALQHEIVTMVNAFETGVEYGKEIFEDSESVYKVIFPTWINMLRDNIYELEIEEMKLRNINITKLDEADFYILLGRYFENCYKSVENISEKTSLFFYNLIFSYQRKIMSVLKE